MLGADARGRAAIAASHGGVYAAYVAAKAGLKAVILSDAGVGRERAGISGLAYLATMGMPAAAIEQCAGPPRGISPTPGATTLLYRAQDLKNYCQVALLVRDGRVLSFTADYAAPEFLYLRDGSNYCGRIFRQCLR